MREIPDICRLKVAWSHPDMHFIALNGALIQDIDPAMQLNNLSHGIDDACGVPTIEPEKNTRTDQLY